MSKRSHYHLTKPEACLLAPVDLFPGTRDGGLSLLWQAKFPIIRRQTLGSGLRQILQSIQAQPPPMSAQMLRRTRRQADKPIEAEQPFMLSQGCCSLVGQTGHIVQPKNANMPGKRLRHIVG